MAGKKIEIRAVKSPNTHAAEKRGAAIILAITEIVDICEKIAAEKGSVIKLAAMVRAIG